MELGDIKMSVADTPCPGGMTAKKAPRVDASRFSSQSSAGSRLDASRFSSPLSDSTSHFSENSDSNAPATNVKINASRFVSQFSNDDRLACNKVWMKPTVSFHCASEATTVSSLPGMTATAESLPSAFPTKDSLPFMQITKDSLPSFTKDSLPPLDEGKDEGEEVRKTVSKRTESKTTQGNLTSATVTSASASENPSESERELFRRSRKTTFAPDIVEPQVIEPQVERPEVEPTRGEESIEVLEAPADADSTADEAMEAARKEEARVALIKAKEAWKQRREAKQAKRKVAKRPSYGELLRKSEREKRDPLAVCRPPSPSSCMMRKKIPEPDPVPEAPRIINPSEKLQTIMSVSCVTSVKTSHQGSMQGSLSGSKLGSGVGSRLGSLGGSQRDSRMGSRFGSRVGSQMNSRVGSQLNSRIGSRCNTLDHLPELSMDFRQSARTTTRDSLPPIGDDTESEDCSDEDSESNTEMPSSSEASQYDGPAKPSGPDLAASLRAAQEEIAALKRQMEELQFDNTQLVRENEVLKALASWNIESQTSEGGLETNAPTAKERWLQRREERRERRKTGKVCYGAWLQAQHEQVVQSAM